MYFKNKSTGKVFVSPDGETLINPTGKRIALNEDLFEEVDDAPEELTEVQKQELQKAERASLAKMEAAEEARLKSTEVKYQGCTMTLDVKKRLEKKESILIVAVRHWYEINIKNEKNLYETINQKLEEIARKHGYRRIQYRLITGTKEEEQRWEKIEQRRLTDSMNRSMDRLQRDMVKLIRDMKK